MAAAILAGAARAQTGSVLAFLPGRGRDRAHRPSGWRTGSRPMSRLRQLHGSFEPAEQRPRRSRRAPAGRRKLVLATSIAETSADASRECGSWSTCGLAAARRAMTAATGLTRARDASARVAGGGGRSGAGRAGASRHRGSPTGCGNEGSDGGAARRFDTPEILEADLIGAGARSRRCGAWPIRRALRFLDPPPRAGLDEARGAAGERSMRSMPMVASPIMAARIARAAAAAAARPYAAGPRAEGGCGTAARSGGAADGAGARRRRCRSRAAARAVRTRARAAAEEARGLAGRWTAMAGADTAKAPSPGLRPTSPPRERWESGGEVGRHLARAYPGPGGAAGGGARAVPAGQRAGGEPRGDGRACRGAVPGGRRHHRGGGDGPDKGRSGDEKEVIEELFASQIVEETAMAFDRASRSVRARRVRRLGALRLEDAPVKIADTERAAAALAEGIAEGLGIAELPWTKEQQALRQRAGELSRGEARGRVAGPFGCGARRRHGLAGAEHFRADGAGRDHRGGPGGSARGAAAVRAAAGDRTAAAEPLRGAVGIAAAHRLCGRERAGARSAGAGTVGLDRHPSVAGGKVPLLLVLLSPAHRPIQTTRDLPGFWRGSWKDVAKDLKGRYPGLYWPEDPVAAVATARAKPRGT